MRGIEMALTLRVARAAVMLTLASGAAAAADHPAPVIKTPPPAVFAPSWTGFYIGAGVGTRSSQTDSTVTRSTNGGANSLGACPNSSSGCVLGEPLHDTALRISPYIGFNWQFAPQWVAGVEADYGFASKTTTLNGMIYPAINSITGDKRDSFSVKTTWDASVRGRLGFLSNPNLLVYATGGAAWIHIESTSTCSTVVNGDCGLGLTTPPNITNAMTKAGWTVGGGIEAMLGHNWLVRGEYRYADFGTISNTDIRTVTFVPTQRIDTYDLRIKTHTATLGLAYKFGGGAAPAGTAQAATYAAVPPAAPSWRGFYVGLGGGTRSTKTDASVRSYVFNGVNQLPGTCANPFGCAPDEVLNGTAFRLSPYIGFNWQLAQNWVAGIEGDFGFVEQTTRLGGMNYPFINGNFLNGTESEAFSVRTRWDASLRGRVGFLATPSLLLYATGGAAWMRIESTSTCSSFTNSICSPANTGGPFALTNATTRLGWTMGGGLEHQLWSNWLVRAEYRYADFGTITNVDVRSGVDSLAVAYDIRVKSHTTNFGVAYKF